MKLLGITLIPIACALALSPGAGGQSTDPFLLQKAYERVLREPTPEAFSAYLATLEKVGNEYLVEGDLLRTEQELRNDLDWARSPAGAAKADEQPGRELVVSRLPNGARDYWVKREDRVLTYSVDRASFSTPEDANTVIDNMASAAAKWVKACETCGISFQYREDSEPSHERVIFIVRARDVNGKFIASAPFPSYAPSRRYLYVDPSYFTTTYDRVGVFRHELGHLLGYRHEQVRGVPGCRREGKDWIPITEYDPGSVMHYVCGGGGDHRFLLTELDERGHRTLYGG